MQKKYLALVNIPRQNKKRYRQNNDQQKTRGLTPTKIAYSVYYLALVKKPRIIQIQRIATENTRGLDKYRHMLFASQ